jgi:serine/threonine protein kinase
MGRSFAPKEALALRLIKEARAASALSHPNIITVHDITCDGDVDFMVMEFVAGKTLDQLIGRTGLKLNDTLKYGAQIAAALATAHAAGIIHRDLKPGNVMVAEGGLVKVLDFGLAKLAEPATSEVAATQTRTEVGVIVGTAAYMSPEQAQGKKLDARSDIFSFGSVLYEMVTGQRAFQGETKLSTLSAIVDKEPTPVSELAEQTPPELERLIVRCLRKDPERRLQHMGDAKLVLEDLKEESDSGKLQAPARPRPHVSAPAMAALVLLLLAGMAFWLTRPLPPPRVSNYVQLSNDSRGKSPGIATDGSRIYFTEPSGAGWALMQVPVAGGMPIQIPTPFPNTQIAGISPDGSEMLITNFLTLPQQESQLWRFPTTGGTPRRVGDVTVSPGGAAWSPDKKKIAYTHGSDLFVVNPDGTDSQKIATVPGEPSLPRWSPDGKVLRFSVEAPKSAGTAIWEVAAEGKNLHRLFSGWNDPPDEQAYAWTPDARYFLLSSAHGGSVNEVWAIREKAWLLQPAARLPAQLTTGAMDIVDAVPSKDGKKLFVLGGQPRGQLVRYDAKAGQFVPFLGGLSAIFLSFTRDGQWVSYTTYPQAELWRSKTDGSEPLQLTFRPAGVMKPSWSPDGKQIAFVEFSPNKPQRIRVVSAEGGTPQDLTLGEGGYPGYTSPDWSPDGNSLLFQRERGPGVPSTLHVYDFRTRQVSSIPQSEDMRLCNWSPDGRTIAARGRDSKGVMVFNTDSKKWSKLTELPVGFYQWSKDGKHIYFDTLVVNEPAIYRVRVADRKLEKVVSLKDLPRRAWGSFGAWTGLVRDDSPLALRDASTQEIYALDVDFP